MKRILPLLLIICLLLPLCGCRGKKAEPQLSHNVARLYTPLTRESRFALDAKLIEGSVPGKAYMDNSADGRAALAWVDTAVWYVSEKGVEKLGVGISSAEISFDGRLALWQDGDALMLLDGKTGERKTLDTGIDTLVQLAVSPKSESVMFTAIYSGDLTQRVTKLCRGGALTEMFEGRGATVLAVSDDAETIYFLEGRKAEFKVSEGGRETTISSEVGAASNYNFTNDLDEAAFSTDDGSWRLFRLKTGESVDLGSGYQFTLKTDIYSMNMITAFVYINDTDTFTDGFWVKRGRDANDDYIYTVCLMDEEGAITEIAGNVRDYAAAPDGSGVYYNAEGVVSFADIKGGTKVIFPMASGLALTDNGRVYCLNAASGVSWYDGGQKSLELPGGDATSVSAIGSVGLAIDADGALYSLKGTKMTKLMDNVTRMDKRWGQLIVYANETDIEGEKLYDVYMTADGIKLELMARSVQP